MGCLPTKSEVESPPPTENSVKINAGKTPKHSMANISQHDEATVEATAEAVMRHEDEDVRRRLSTVALGDAIIEKAPTGRGSYIGAGLYPGAVPDGVKAESLPLWWGHYSRPGNDPSKKDKENQDTFCAHDNFDNDPNMAVFCVMDGHGPNGHKVAAFIREHWIAECVGKGLGGSGDGGESEGGGSEGGGSEGGGSEQDEGEADPDAAAAAAAADVFTAASAIASARVSGGGAAAAVAAAAADVFTAASAIASARLRETGINTDLSGTTAVALLIKGDKLLVANVGDSRCIRVGGGVAEDLSDDHKPEREDEAARIKRTGGRIFTYGVPRVWLPKRNIPGLAMTRSFGDNIAKRCGVTALPEVKGYRLRPEDEFIILASDGVWEFLSSQAAGDVVSAALEEGLDPQQAAERLVDEAVAKWHEEENVVDDTTVVVIYLTPPGSKGAAVLANSERCEEAAAAEGTGAGAAEAEADEAEAVVVPEEVAVEVDEAN